MSDQHELCERVAALEARREADQAERTERRNYLDKELEKIFTAVEGVKEWGRVQLFGNGTKEGCFDERLKRLERFMEAWDWRKALFSRLLVGVLEAVIIGFILWRLGFNK